MATRTPSSKTDGTNRSEEIMEPELLALASSGATTLITLMISDAWTQVKERVAVVLDRTGDEDAVLRKLESDRTDLVAAIARGDSTRAVAIEAAWRARLLESLESTPTLAGDLQGLTSSDSAVYNHISGATRSSVIVQAGRIYASTFHAPPAD